ncbi:MAG: FtsX-like permease family protein [Candidatus Latescibacteria bacterium]|nr:FtsX-like permease family protein [Candidatus Latescibacterota bacterium]
MTRLLSLIGVVFALAMIALMNFADPLALSRAVTNYWAWNPVPPKPSRLVEQTQAERIKAAAADIATADIEAEIRRFAAWDSRVPGYPGAESAADYIEGQFAVLGLEDIRSENFAVTVPIDKGAHLEVDGRRLTVHALWPNGVRTSSLPKGGVAGPLIYGGKGATASLDGKQVEDSIVLMDFDCGQSYLGAASLGAQAIVFFDNGGINQRQAADKFLKVPVDVPRFWIERDQALELLARLQQGPATARVEARMDWEEVEGRNIYAWLQGSDELLPAKSRAEGQKWSEQTIVIQAYYDAVSVVPALAPGAENAAGIVALLHLARKLQEHKPYYNVLFLATSGHFQGLAGINDFLYRHARRSEHFHELIAPEERIDFDLMLSLDLSSRDSRTISFGMGTFYNSNWATDNYVKYMLTPYSKRLSLAVEEIFADTSRHVEGLAPPKRTWKNFMPIPLGFASEAAAFVGQKALALATPNDARELVDTPLDLPESVDFDNLTRQLETLTAMTLWSTRDADLLKPTKLELEDYGHSLEGSIYWFDRAVNFAVPKAPVSQALVTYQQLGPNSVGGIRTLITDKANDQGRFRFDIMRNRYSNIIKAYEIDTEGRIVSAPDMGEEGDKTYPMEHPWGWWENEMLQVVFKCRTLSLFDIVDSQYLSVLDHLTVLDDRDGTPQYWGADYVENQSTEEGKVTLAAAVYAKPGTRVKALMSTSLFGVRYLLSGVPEELMLQDVRQGTLDAEALKKAYGRGYPVDEGRVLRPAYAAARDMWYLDEVRIAQLAQYGVRNDKFRKLHEDAQIALQEAQGHLQERRYSQFNAAVRKAWGLEARGYPDVKATADDTVYGVIFYFALLLPFAFFCERLFFGFADVRKQIGAAAGVFIAIFALMRFIHPAFQLSSSPYIIFLAFVIFAIGGTALAMILGRFTRAVAERKRAAAGVHETDIGRLSATAAAIALGISNLRKRKLRTGLTVVTITLLTFTAQAFTSVESFLKFYQIPRGNTPAYEGALLRDRGWRGLQQSVLEYAQSAFGQQAQVAPRSWYVSPIVGERAYIDLERRQEDVTRRSFAFGLLGLTPQEREVMGIEDLLVGADSRWFAPGEDQVCVLPATTAGLLGIGEADIGRAQVWILGQPYRVIGLIDGEALDQVRDLDDESLMPVDTVAEAKKMEEMAGLDPRQQDTAAIETFSHLLAGNIVLLPYDRVIDLGGSMRSIALANFAPATMLGAVEDFVSRVAVPLFVGEGGRVRVYTSMGTASLSGMANLIIPLVIASLIVLNTMLGSVYERDREIGVYSSVGLAPSHIAALFIAESLVFATLGAVFGYLVGQTTTLVLTRYDLMGGMVMNYSSLSAIVSTFTVMATVVVSTIYPARRAASMSVPDVTRRWSFPDPVGDDWRFDFPFTIGGADALGVCAYLYRVFGAYGEGSVGDFMTEGVQFDSAGSTGQPVYRLRLQVWLAPYDLGVSQQVSLRMLPADDVPGIYRIEMELQRVSGDVASWRRLNTGFLDVLRKRFLVWRTISPDVQRDYLEDGRKMVVQEEVVG